MRLRALLSATVAPGSRNRRLLQYVLVGALGLGINQGVLFLATGIVGLSYVIGGTLSRVVSVLANYAINDAWTWRGRGDAGPREYVVRGVKYVLTRLVGIAIGLGALVLFVELLGLHYLVANVLAVGVGIVWGFGASERWVWRSDDAEPNRLERALSRLRARLAPTSRDTPKFDGGQVQRRLPTLDRYELRERLAGVDRATLAVFALAGALFVGFTVYTSLLYRGYQLTGADFGSYLHMFWTTVNGHGFLQQGKFRASHPSGVYWGAHFSLTLLAFLPFFAVWQSPYALLVGKSFVLAASVPLLWFVAREHLESRRLAGLLVLSYAFNPFLWSAWAFDFQEQSLLPLLVLAGYLMYVRGRRVAFLALLTLAMFTNEFVIPISFGFLLGLTASKLKDGALSVPDRRTLLAGFGLVVAAHVIAGLVMSQFNTISGVPVRVLAPAFQPLVEESRIGLGGLIPIALLNPDAVVRAFLTGLDQKILYLLLFSVPLLFVAYADEVTLGSLAPFVGFSWLISTRGSYLQFRAHYPLYLLPFVYIGAVRALGRWGHLLPRPSGRSRRELPLGAAAKVAVAVLLLNAGAFVLIDGGNMKPTQPKTDHHEVIQAGLATVPAEASVVTQNDLYPHVARRPASSFIVSPYEFDRYEREVGPITPEYVVYDTELRGFWVTQVLDSFDDRLGTEYGLYRYEDGFWVFRRGFAGTPTAVTSDAPVTWVTDEHTFNTGTFTTTAGTRTTQRGTIVSDDGSAGERVWYGPYAVFAPGTYTATFDVYAAGTGERPAGRVDVAVGSSHQVVASQSVTASPKWQEVTVQFTLDRPTDKVEFRGTHGAPGGTVAFRGVTVVRQSSSSNAAAVTAETTAAATESIDAVGHGSRSVDHAGPAAGHTSEPGTARQTHRYRSPLDPSSTETIQ